MTTRINRHSWALTVDLNTAVSTTAEIDLRQAAGGTIFFDTDSTTTSLTYHASDEEGGTYEALYDKDGAAVTQTVAADRAYPLPVACFGCRFIKIVANNADSVKLSLKG